MKIYKNNKFFGVISLVDLLILIILIALGVAAYNRFFSYKNENETIIKSDVKFTYKIKILYLAETTEKMLNIGDNVYDKLSNTNIGKIIDIKIEPARDEFTTQQGEIVLKEVPNKLDVTLEIEANGTYNEGEYLASKLIRILVGENKNIKTKYVEMTGQIIDIKMGE